MTLTDYLDLELLRINLELPADYNKAKLTEIVIESNQELDVQLKPYADSIPLEPGNIIYGQIRKCALHYARALWFNHILEHDVEELERKRYEAKLKAIRQSFMADRNTRTISVVAAKNPIEDIVLMPSHRDTFIDIFS